MEVAEAADSAVAETAVDLAAVDSEVVGWGVVWVEGSAAADSAAAETAADLAAAGLAAEETEGGSEGGSEEADLESVKTARETAADLAAADSAVDTVVDTVVMMGSNVEWVWWGSLEDRMAPRRRCRYHFPPRHCRSPRQRFAWALRQIARLHIPRELHPYW